MAASFAGDLYRVSGTRPRRHYDRRQAAGPVVIIGVLGQDPAIDQLVKAGKLDPRGLDGEWEAFVQTVVDDPLPGVSRALVIAGSDRRGAVFGTYDISQRIGVSPWYWFADVPVARRTDVWIPAGERRDHPRVRYRGFFINDEDPCFSGWAKKKFGGVNSAAYARVFELLLRMKGNYLWPAMWGKAFDVDDPDNMVLADAMGVVMGTSHHEVMMRAQAEWHMHSSDGVRGGAWDYRTNAANLRAFWRGGIERMMSKGPGQSYESVVTIGMRGDGDEAMAEGTAVPLLEKIVADQRQIIADVTGKPAKDTPQVWALYKEVQDYYDDGMRVPDDVILLFSDDNWGQIRRLPDPRSKPRSGGYGVYYHFDYVGVPRNYKWIDTNQVEKVWQQMDLAYARDARAMWIVNVGDIKPMEYPLSFVMAMAWNPEEMTSTALSDYPKEWARATFGDQHASIIGGMITDYSKFAARRKPELIDQNTFALGGVTADGLDGGEFGAMVAQWDQLEKRMLAVRANLEPRYLDAYYQLLEFPISAMANLYRLYYAAAWNKLLASRNDARANVFADQVQAAFKRDGVLTRRYHTINGGKWDGMMAQVHMSYVIWNDPTQQTMPSITRVAGDTPPDRRGKLPRFVSRPRETPGVVVLEAPAFSRTADGKHMKWTAIPNLGRTQGAVVTLPQGMPATTAEDSIWVEYDVTVDSPGPGSLTLYFAPTLNTTGAASLRLGVSLDTGPVQALDFKLAPTGGAQNTPAEKRWAEAVCNNSVRVDVSLGPVSAGQHKLRLWRIDDNVVVERLVLATREVQLSYLGAPNSPLRPA
ncbi:glycosyl hydrolase 115 family protein [Hephaestia mangrovi]|uniref:glycosyl hydrolase 115 family protein n=1 Tax=Hephaestia mangrovi TaxID=2873268 RepID=UPI0034E261C1